MKTRVDSSFGLGQDNKKDFVQKMNNGKHKKKLSLLGWDKNEIKYQYNSENFRSIEFISPHDAIACFGCSHTEGEGIRQEYRWSEFVAKTLKLKCYNFGIGGSGINSHYDLINKWVPIIRPKAVFVFASYPFRYDFYYKNNRITLNHNIHTKGNNPIEKKQFEIIYQLLSEDNRNFNSNYEKTISAIKYNCLQLNIPCVIIKCEEYFLNDPVDRQARDLQHPGEMQNRRIGKAMLEEYHNAGY